MPWEVFFKQNCNALLAILVLLWVLTLFNQVLIKRRYLYNLLAFPASRQHWALFPIVDIDWLLIEILIKLATKVAHVFIFEIFRLHLLAFKLRIYERWLLLLLERTRLILSFTSWRFLLPFLLRGFLRCFLALLRIGSLRVDVCLNSLDFRALLPLFRLATHLCQLGF